MNCIQDCLKDINYAFVMLVEQWVCRSAAGCGYHQLVYSSLVGLKQQDRSLVNDSLLAAR